MFGIGLGSVSGGGNIRGVGAQLSRGELSWTRFPKAIFFSVLQ